MSSCFVIMSQFCVKQFCGAGWQTEVTDSSALKWHFRTKILVFRDNIVLLCLTENSVSVCESRWPVRDTINRSSDWGWRRSNILSLLPSVLKQLFYHFFFTLLSPTITSETQPFLKITCITKSSIYANFSTCPDLWQTTFNSKWIWLTNGNSHIHDP